MYITDDGRIAEFDTPYNLINNTDSLFRHLCEQTGELETLMELARLGSPEEGYEEHDEIEYEEDEETPEMEIEDYETEDDIQGDQQTGHESGHEVEDEQEEEEQEPEIDAKYYSDEEDS
jgi:hypothetical protein